MDASRAPRFDSLASRLRWAVGQQPPEGRQRGLRLFQRRLTDKAPGLDGTALSSIQAYLNGSVTPSLRWVEVASGILGVRADWLGFGSGSPTAGEQSGMKALVEPGRTGPATTALGSRGARDALGDYVTSVFNEEFPAFWRLPPASRRDLIDALARHVRPLVHKGDSFHAAFRRHVRYLAGPFSVTRVDPGSLDPADLALIIAGLVRAIEIASWKAEVKEGGFLG